MRFSFYIYAFVLKIDNSKHYTVSVIALLSIQASVDSYFVALITFHQEDTFMKKNDIKYLILCGMMMLFIGITHNAGAASAAFPKVEKQGDGMLYTFEKLPENAEELRNIADFSDPKHTTAFFLVALKQYVKDSKSGLEMIEVLYGPRKISDFDKHFLKERLSDKKYLPNSYFEGASVDNDYTPSEPFQIVLYDDTHTSEEGYIRVFVHSKGADSRRYLTLRSKGNNWYIWEYPFIVTGIRLPASQDVWK